MGKQKVLMIDNYDSFTYNLVQFLGILGANLVIYRNDVITTDEIKKISPSRIVISPGPKAPSDAGISKTIIQEFGKNIKTLGVCLGHQCIGEVFGGKTVRAPRVMHGKTSKVYHDGKGIFKGLPSPFNAARYHSLVVDPETLPSCLEVSSFTEDGVIMGIRHREYPIEGIQFHPESFMTEFGIQLLANFLED